MAEFATDIEQLRKSLIGRGDSARLAAFNEARQKAMTDDQARFEILRRILPEDNEGTIMMPIDTSVANQFKGWPRREEEVNIPTAASVLKTLGYTDTKDKKGNVTKLAAEKFVEDYPKKRKYITEKLEEKDKSIGKKANDILKQVFRESVYDIADKQTAERREAVISGTAEDTPWYDKVASKAMTIFTPREKDAYMRGTDPTVGDYVSDIGGNALMVVPGAKYAQLASKLASKIPGMVKLGQLASSKVPRATKVVSGAFGNSVAPVGTELLQYAGDAVDSDAEAELNTSRAVLGALTNIGVNDILIPKGAALNRMLLDREAGRAATRELNQSLRGANTAPKWIDPQAYVVNKLGNVKAADYAANKFGIAKETMEALKQNETDIDDVRYRKPEKEAAAAKAVLDAAQDEVDKKYLQMVIDNPDILKTSTDTGFKMWLVTRGNDLLRGTSYHRPAWDIGWEDN